jgi:hypothetical protein
MFRYFGHHFREVISSLLTLVVTVGGFYLAWTVNPAWLNRAGAAIIIIGVLAATSRLQDWIEQKAHRYIAENLESTAAQVITELESQHGEFSVELKQTIRSKAGERLINHLATTFESDKRRMKSWEVTLVVLGTFLNGFGDWLVTIAKPYGI